MYRAEGLNLSPYSKMIRDRVEVWKDAEARGDVPREEAQRLADLPYSTVLVRAPEGAEGQS